VASESDALEQLYAAAPEEFVSERKRLERSLRDEGRAQDADELAGLRKPPLPVFAANRLARERAEDIAKLIEAGERLASGHRAADAEELRGAQRELTDCVATLVRHAQLSGAMEQRLAVLLRAAASDPDSAKQLRRGVLAEELEPATFDALAGMAVKAPKPRAAPKRERNEAAERRRRERIEQLEAQLSDARHALRDAERRLAEAERERKRASRLIDQLSERLEESGNTV
jgi:chromosome segregation ATPase